MPITVLVISHTLVVGFEVFINTMKLDCYYENNRNGSFTAIITHKTKGDDYIWPRDYP